MDTRLLLPKLVLSSFQPSRAFIVVLWFEAVISFRHSEPWLFLLLKGLLLLLHNSYLVGHVGLLP